MPAHTVEPGDCLASIASAHGLLPETLWDHPNNSSLKEQREDPHILLPGDVVDVPELELKEVAVMTDRVHTFRLELPKVLFRLHLLSGDEEAAELPYVLEVDGVEYEGTTDDEGWLEQEIPASARSGVLRLDEGARSYELAFGHLDPISEDQGAQQRLRNLGFYGGPADAELGPKTCSALRQFQRREGLEVTGELDDATRDALRAGHKS